MGTTPHDTTRGQVLVNVGRAGAANLDVIQEVEYVKQEAKIVYLLECLQKTAPPVCIFCEKKQVCDTTEQEKAVRKTDREDLLAARCELSNTTTSITRRDSLCTKRHTAGVV